MRTTLGFALVLGGRSLLLFRIDGLRLEPSDAERLERGLERESGFHDANLDPHRLQRDRDLGGQ